MLIGSGESGLPGTGHDLTLNFVAFFHAQLGEVREERRQPVSVVDNDRVAREIQRLGERDCAVIRRTYRRARRTEKIDASVRAATLAVEIAYRAEVARRCAVDRQDK